MQEGGEKVKKKKKKRGIRIQKEVLVRIECVGVKETENKIRPEKQAVGERIMRFKAKNRLDREKWGQEKEIKGRLEERQRGNEEKRVIKDYVLFIAMASSFFSSSFLLRLLFFSRLYSTGTERDSSERREF